MQSEFPQVEGTPRSSSVQAVDRLAAIRQEMEYLNTIGKRFVAAIDRFQVHRALLAALQELYRFAACSILLEGEPFELSIIPCYPLSEPFLQAMIQNIASAARVMDFPPISAEELAKMAYLDAPDDLSGILQNDEGDDGTVGSFLNVPLTVENRIIGMLSLFDERPEAFDTEHLKLTTMIADYAAVALENVRLHERELALWREAEAERQRLALIIGSMAEGLLITDTHGKITLLNHSARHLLAQAQVELREDIPLHTIAQAGEIEWLKMLVAIIERALKGETVTNQELIAGESGDTVPLTLSVSAAPLYEARRLRSHLTGVVTVLNDITSSKQVEKLKDEFVSIVSHELRTPLTAIKGYTQHVMRRIERRLRKLRAEQQTKSTSGPLMEPPESADLRNLSIVQGQAEHLERLVNDLLDLSRVQWGKLELHYTSFSLEDVLAACIRSAQVSTELHTLELDIQTQDSRVVADALRLGQVVGNVLDNAIKYSPQGGSIIVRLSEHEGGYLISIIDQGIGIGTEYLDHIFERFYRVRNKASRQFAGIGLGLYVTKAIVERHGGSIWVTNNNGMGSTFSFTLPKAPAE